MAVGGTIFIIAILIIAVWLIFEAKRARHKFFAIFLIVLIIFTYFSFTLSIKGRNIDFGSASGWIEAGGLYLNWLGHIFSNVKSITANVVKMDWKAGNSTTGK